MKRVSLCLACMCNHLCQFLLQCSKQAFNCRPNRRSFLALSLAFLIVTASFPFLVPLVKATGYWQIPVKVNVVEGANIPNGAIFTSTQKERIAREIDNILKSNGLNWQVTLTVKNVSDPDKTIDRPGDVRVAEHSPLEETPEEKSLWKQGEEETRNGGWKVFVVRKILKETGAESDGLGATNASARTTIISEPSATAEGVWGKTWAHELGHILGLQHWKVPQPWPPIGDRPVEDLMYPLSNHGTNLESRDIDHMKDNLSSLNPVYVGSWWQFAIEEIGLYGFPPPLRRLPWDWIDTVGDSTPNFVDVQHVRFTFGLVGDDYRMDIRTYLGGLVPQESLVSPLNYSVALNSDNNSSTGSEFAGWNGIDFIISVSVYPDAVEGALYFYPSLAEVGSLESRVEPLCKFVGNGTVPPIRIQDRISVAVPLDFIGELSNPFRAGVTVEYGMAVDRVEIFEVHMTDPEYPSLTLESPFGVVGTTVTANGTGFESTSAVSLFFDQTSVASVITDPNGSFQASFQVPVLPSGHYLVDAIDELNQFGVCVFSITDFVSSGPRNVELIQRYYPDEYSAYAALKSGQTDIVAHEIPQQLYTDAMGDSMICLGLASPTSYWAWSTGLLGVVNMEGVGPLNSYTYLNAYKVDLSPVIVGCVGTPDGLNIIYNDNEDLHMMNLYSTITSPPYDLAVDQRGFVADYDVGSYVDPDDGLEKSRNTYYYRSNAWSVLPVIGEGVEKIDARNVYASSWYVHQTPDSWWNRFVQGVKHLSIDPDFSYLSTYWNTSSVEATQGNTPVMSFNLLQQSPLSTYHESSHFPGQWLNLSEPVYWVDEVLWSTGTSVETLHQGMDWEIYARDGHIHPADVRILNTSITTGVILVKYWAVGDAHGYTPGNLSWQQSLEGCGMYYATALSPGIGGNLTLETNRYFHWMQTPLLGEVDFVRKLNSKMKIDIFDLVIAAGAYGSTGTGEPDPRWVPGVDVAPNGGIVDIFDIVTIASAYGEEWDCPPP